MIRIRVAHYGTDRFGRASVMVSNQYYDPDRPGWSQSITQRFIDARDIEQARAIASRLKTRGRVDSIKPL